MNSYWFSPQWSGYIFVVAFDCVDNSDAEVYRSVDYLREKRFYRE